jgi:hypothetical protein
MALFIAKRRKEFNEGPLLILSIDGAATTVVSPVRRSVGGYGLEPQCVHQLVRNAAAHAPRHYSST